MQHPEAKRRAGEEFSSRRKFFAIVVFSSEKISFNHSYNELLRRVFYLFLFGFYFYFLDIFSFLLFFRFVFTG